MFSADKFAPDDEENSEVEMQSEDNIPVASEAVSHQSVQEKTAKICAVSPMKPEKPVDSSQLAANKSSEKQSSSFSNFEGLFFVDKSPGKLEVS